ncbi:hypothetical protein K402DRAFT_26754 [Aulographum hederae CBS 113979]|uniref:Uncharacterized protein n=1 Tax=Aulographum hederae CBS 113979 TaxID=1176131 RepID=A0A6G1H6F2_9PEZI|nr:hypothetical protein K402DRAFT_26754 [Aulographum hederae CBS 113979]
MLRRIYDTYVIYAQRPVDVPRLPMIRAALKHRQGLVAFDVCSHLARCGIALPWDIIDIIANICHYKIRINTAMAAAWGLQVGTCVFALALMNGDISLLQAGEEYRFAGPKKNLAWPWCTIPATSIADLGQVDYLLAPAGVFYARCFDVYRLSKQKTPLSDQGLLCHGELFERRSHEPPHPVGPTRSKSRPRPRPLIYPVRPEDLHFTRQLVLLPGPACTF